MMRKKVIFVMLLLGIVVISGCIYKSTIDKNSGTININTLPNEMTESLLFSHFNFMDERAELYLVDNDKVKLLTSKKSPNKYIQRFSAEVSPQKDKIVYRYSVKGESDTIEYTKESYEGLYYTPSSPLYIANIDGSNEQILVDVGEKEDIPRYIWSDDGKYVFYNLVDYSTQRWDEGAWPGEAGHVIEVSVWKVNIETKEKEMLYKGKAMNWNPFDFYIIGFLPETRELLVSYQAILDPPYKNYEWQIGKIKTEIPPGFNINYNYDIFFARRGSNQININRRPPFMMDNGKIVYMLSTTSKPGEFRYSDIDLEEIGIIDVKTKEIKIIKSKPEKEGGMWFKPLNTKMFLFTEGIKEEGKDYYFEEKILNSQGNEVSMSLPKWPLVSVSPKTKFRLSEFRGKADLRGLQEWGLVLYYPNSDKNITITEHNADFIGWIE